MKHKFEQFVIQSYKHILISFAINSILFYPIIRNIKISLLELAFILFTITIEAYTIYSTFKLNISIIIKILTSIIFGLFITEFAYIIFLKLFNKNIFEQSFAALRYSILIIIILYAILNDAFKTLEIFYEKNKSSNMNDILIFAFLINASIILSIIKLIISLFAHIYKNTTNIKIYSYTVNNNTKITNNNNIIPKKITQRKTKANDIK